MSKRPFHILRDALNHDVPMMGGMWGGAKGRLPFTIQEICLEYSKMAKAKGGDQDFLTEKVWPEVQKSGYVFLYNFFDAFFDRLCHFNNFASGTSRTAATHTVMILRDFLSLRDSDIRVNSSDALVKPLNSPHFTKLPPTFRCSLAIKKNVHWSAGRLDIPNGYTASHLAFYSKAHQA
jgi:hypothetical protein